MYKQKKSYVLPHWSWAPKHGLTSINYYRDFRFKQNRSRDYHDADDFRELGIDKIAWRNRGVHEFPTNWDVVYISRGFYVTSWKDKTRKKKQYL